MAPKADEQRDYPDLHDHVHALERAGQLRRVDIAVNKDTELCPLVRWQFRGSVPEEDRRAWLFTNVCDSKGRHYDMPVLIGAISSNQTIYGIGLGVAPEKAIGHWSKALANPLPPRIVSEAVCQELVFTGGALDRGFGLDALPAPITTPGWDNAPYLSALGFLTKDPDTGRQNLGTYRAQIKSPRRLGFNFSIQNRPGGYRHWLKYKERGEKMPAAFVIGGPMPLAYAGMWKIPESVEETAVAGALLGHPLNMVAAKTVDLLVPAEAEIVIEGYLDTEFFEPEGPFGESHGHVNLQEFNGVMEVTAITRRKDAVFLTYMSQLYPNEISSLRAMVLEHNYTEHLRDHLGIKSVIRVVPHQPLTGNQKIQFVVMERGVPRTEVWRALYGAMAFRQSGGKIVFAVNEDINPQNLDSIFWAMAFRSNPHRDMKIVDHKDLGHGPSQTAPDNEDSCLLVDATLKQDFPPVSLPGRAFMERAREIWERDLQLPTLIPETPWFGYSMGNWPKALEEEANRAVAGDFWETGRDSLRRRRNDVVMNTEVTSVDEKTRES